MHQRKSFPDIRRAALKRHKGRLFKVEQRRKFIRNLQFVYVNSSPEQLLVFPHKSWPRQFMFTHFIHSPIYLAFELCAINNQHPTKIKMGIILPTGQWYAPSAVINDTWYCMVLHGTALYCIVLHGIAWYCMVLHGIAWYCIVLHGIAWYCMVLHCIA